MSLVHLYNNRMNVFTRSADRTPTGGVDEETLTPKYTDEPCLIEIIGGGEQEMRGKKGKRISHWLYCDTNLDIVQTDVIDVGARRYDVELVDDVQEKEHHFEIGVLLRT